MTTILKHNLMPLGIAILAVASFSSCASTGNSFDGTHTMSAPKNTTYTMPDKDMPGGGRVKQ